MTTRRSKPAILGLAAALFLCVVSAGLAQDNPKTSGLSERSIAKEDLYAPADLSVVDVDRSMSVFKARREPSPIVVRVDPRAVNLMIEQLNDAFERTRENFLTALEGTYGARQIEIRRINSSKFRSFRNEFQSENPLFPVNLILAQSWAKGYDGDSTRARLVSAMEAVTREYYLADAGADTILFVASNSENENVTKWADVSHMVRIADPGEVIGLEEAGFYVRRGLDAFDRTAGGFLTGLLQPTVQVDEYLTGLLMHERLGAHTVMREIRKGELIVRAGEPIDRWTALALATVDRMGLEPRNTALDAEQPVLAETGKESAKPDKVSPAAEQSTETAESPVYTEVPKSGETERWYENPLYVGAFAGGLAVLMGSVLWRFIRRGRRRGSMLVPRPEQPSNLREAMIPHLARELKNRLVQVLFAQRHALLENEAAASKRVEEMEARLARIQPAIAEKIRQYEQRIHVLEQEIEEKDQETRDLLRAKLVLARKELDAEITRNRLDWN